MKKISSLLALAGLLIVSPTVHAQFADTVISYTSGSGVSASFTNPNAALGAPASGSAVTPFAPPFSNTQIVSIGAGGSLTLQLDTPILNDSSDPFGIDFIIFGNTFFTLSGSMASGTLGGNNTGSTLVEISADDVNWFTLNPALAPTVDGIFPTDGTGNPLIPVDPSLTAASFAGQNLAGVRSLYDGSAGGTGFDLAWAQDYEGDSVNLASADFVRIDVLSGKSEVDAISVVPEPSAFALILSGGILLWLGRKKQKLQSTKIMRVDLFLLLNLFAVSICSATTFTENFTDNPSLDGWQIFGDTNLFQWDSTNQNLAVTWDSSQQNSYFYHPLGATLSKTNDFLITFDLQMSDASAVGFFELGIGLLNFADATSSSFARGTGEDSPNLAEFNYFPDSGEGFGSTLSSTMTDSNSTFSFFEDFVGLDVGTTYRVVLVHRAGSTFMTGNVYTNGQVYSSLPVQEAFGTLTDFRLDTIAVSSYTATNDPFGDSLLAHGTVDNLAVASPLPVGTINAIAAGQVQFASDTNWLYTLQRTTDLQTWTDASISTSGNGTNLFLQDTNAISDKSFYRVRADLP